MKTFFAAPQRFKGNAKIGDEMASFRADQDSCPPDCALRPENGGGCMMYNAPAVWSWEKTQQVGTQDFDAVIARVLAAKGDKFRAFTAGDMPHYSGGKVSARFLRKLVKAAKIKTMISYTHHRTDDTIAGRWNKALLLEAKAQGVAINKSANDWQQVDQYLADGLPTVAVLPVGTTKSVKTAAGNTIRVCPATLPDSTVTCETCKLCENPDRSYAIGFPAHGTKKNKMRIIPIAVAA